MKAHPAGILPTALMRYRKRAGFIRGLQLFRWGLVFSLPAALINGISGFTRPAPFLFLTVPAGVILFYLLSRPPDFLARLDSCSGSGGQIITWTELSADDGENPYLPLLEARVNRLLREHPPPRVFPPPRRFVPSLGVILLLLGSFLFVPGIIRQDLESSSNAGEYISRRLAEVAERDPRFTPLAEKLQEMAEEDPQEQRPVPGNRDWEELSRELTEQVRELERNRLAGLFEEEGQEKAVKLLEMARGEMNPDDIREFILELMGDPGVGDESRRSLPLDYQDYSRDTRGEEDRQSDLARNLMDRLDPENRESRRELQNLAEEMAELAGSGEAEKTGEEENLTPEETSGEREARRNGGSGEGPDDPQEGLPGETTTAAGSRKGSDITGGTDFQPYQGENPQVQLPEGPVLDQGDRGIVRLEGEEKLSLNRGYAGTANDTPVREEAASSQPVPSRYQDLVREYFTVLGTENP